MQHQLKDSQVQENQDGITLKFVKIYKSKNDVPDNIPIDTNDDYARDKNIKEFALVDNYAKN